MRKKVLRPGCQLRRTHGRPGGEARAARGRRRDRGLAERDVPVHPVPDLAAVRQAEPADITFPVDPTFDEHGVEFVHAEATAIDPVARKVVTDGAGGRLRLRLPGRGHRLPQRARRGPRAGPRTATPRRSPRWRTPSRPASAWQRFLRDPGDIVIGATQGAGCFGAAYEFLFNTAYQLQEGRAAEAGVSSRTSPPSRSSGTSASAGCRTGSSCSACSCARSTSTRTPA